MVLTDLDKSARSVLSTPMDTPFDSIFFYKTPLGIVALNEEMNAAYQKKEREEHIMQEVFWQETLEARMMGVYFIEEEEALARTVQREVWQRAGAHTIIHKRLPDTLSEKKTDDENAWTHYENQRKGFALERENTIKRYDQYDKNLETIDPFIKRINPKDKKHAIETLEAKIHDLSNENDREMERIQQILLDPQRMGEGRKALDAYNAKNLQIATLKDYLSVVKGDKVLYDKQGQRVSEFAKADYMVPKGMTLVSDEMAPKSDGLYLLKEGETLTKTNKINARMAFERAEPGFSSVKNLININRGMELSLLQNAPSRKPMAKLTPMTDSTHDEANTHQPVFSKRM